MVHDRNEQEEDVNTLQHMCAMTFATDCLNYARYLPVYYAQLSQMKSDCAEAYDLPYILAYKSQNLRKNLDIKVGGATYTRVIK